MKTIKVKFWCNGGDTEEIVELQMYSPKKEWDNDIQDAFVRWLDNNEDVGWEIIKQKN